MNRLSPVFLLVAAVLGYLWFRDHDRQVAERALWRVKDSSLTARIDSAEKVAAKLKADFRVDTIRLRVQLTRWDTVRAGIDTLSDTVRVPVEVVRYIEKAADSVILACRDGLSTCQRLAAIERKRADLLDERINLLQEKMPDWFQRRASVTVGYGAVRLRDGSVHVGPAVTAGLRIWP